MAKSIGLRLRGSSRDWPRPHRLPEQLQQSDHPASGVWKIVLVVILGSFLSQLDATVVNVSLSSLAAELHTRLSVIQWVTGGYV
jgi:hypothetical protein